MTDSEISLTITRPLFEFYSTGITRERFDEFCWPYFGFGADGCSFTTSSVEVQVVSCKLYQRRLVLNSINSYRILTFGFNDGVSSVG